MTSLAGYALISDVEKTAYIALGSNMGDRELNLLRAVAEVGKLPVSRVTGLSPFYETSPVGFTDQSSFFNAVLRLFTALSPKELLYHLQQIESVIFSRIRSVPNGPRIIDLDILLYGDEVIDTPDLIVPHPKMTERRFVLEPLCMLAPDLKHPVLGQTVVELLARLESDETVIEI